MQSLSAVIDDVGKARDIEPLFVKEDSRILWPQVLQCLKNFFDHVPRIIRGYTLYVLTEPPRVYNARDNLTKRILILRCWKQHKR